jgi:hypothetical protein
MKVRQFLLPKGIRCHDLNDSARKRLSTAEDKLNRWSEHFIYVLNSDLTVYVDLNSVSAAQAPEDQSPPSREMLPAVKYLRFELIGLIY